jgi:hypothetical protein
MKKPVFAGAFEGLQAARGAKPKTQIPCGDDNKKEVREIQPAMSEAKKTHPDWRQVTLYMRKATHTAAKRKWEDEGGKEFSDLAEKLFAEYAAR